jgi:hypothetical protein
MTKIFILPFSGIIAFSTNSVSVETGIKISVIDVVDFVVVEEVVTRKISMHKSKRCYYIFKFLKLVVCISLSKSAEADWRNIEYVWSSYSIL